MVLVWTLVREEMWWAECPASSRERMCLVVAGGKGSMLDVGGPDTQG